MPENDEEPMVAYNIAALNESIPDETPMVPNISDDNVRNDNAGLAHLTPIPEMDIEYDIPMVVEQAEATNAEVSNIQAPDTVADVLAVPSITNTNDNANDAQADAIEAVRSANLDDNGLPTTRRRATPALDSAISNLGKKKATRKTRSKSKASYDFISIDELSSAIDFHKEFVFIHFPFHSTHFFVRNLLKFEHHFDLELTKNVSFQFLCSFSFHFYFSQLTKRTLATRLI